VFKCRLKASSSCPYARPESTFVAVKYFEKYLEIGIVLLDLSLSLKFETTTM
jgi:hypothetical protein